LKAALAVINLLSLTTATGINSPGASTALPNVKLRSGASLPVSDNSSQKALAISGKGFFLFGVVECYSHPFLAGGLPVVPYTTRETLRSPFAIETLYTPNIKSWYYLSILHVIFRVINRKNGGTHTVSFAKQGIAHFVSCFMRTLSANLGLARRSAQWIRARWVIS